MNVEANENRIQIQLELPVPIKWVWALLTEREHIDQWWGEHVKLESGVGGKFIEAWSDGNRDVITSGNITHYDPPNVLAITWADDDWSGDTRVVFQLSEQDEATQLLIEHSGWQIHPEPKRSNLIDDHAEGWTQNLENLINYAKEVQSKGNYAN